MGVLPKASGVRTSLETAEGIDRVSESRGHLEKSQPRRACLDSSDFSTDFTCSVSNDTTHVEICDGVTEIPRGAFYECRYLEEVIIPITVTKISTSAFVCCNAMQHVDIPNSVTTIGRHAFKGMEKLQSIVIPNSVTSLGDAAFTDCVALESVHISSNLTTIGTGMFYACSALTYVTIPNSVTLIKNDSFKLCTSLAQVTMSNSITQVGAFAFRNTSLSLVHIPRWESDVTLPAEPGDWPFDSDTVVTWLTHSPTPGPSPSPTRTGTGSGSGPESDTGPGTGVGGPGADGPGGRPGQTQTDMPTPSPTDGLGGGTNSTVPRANGDPHIRNVAGDSFDVNQPGNYTMLRMPIEGPPALEMVAQIKPVGNACSLFITEATLRGELLGKISVRFRAMRHNAFQSQHEPDTPFAIQLRADSPWLPLEDFSAGEESRLEEFQAGPINLVIKASREVAATVEGFFAIVITDPDLPEPNNHALIKISKQRRWINVKVLRLGVMGYVNIGGLLGTEKPKAEWSETSQACQIFRRNHQNTSSAMSLLQDVQQEETGTAEASM